MAPSEESPVTRDEVAFPQPHGSGAYPVDP